MPDGEVIVRQWDYTDSFLVIAGGEVEVRHRPEGGAERRVATLGAGDWFGEMSLISGRRRNATVVACGEARILEIPRKAILKLLAISPRAKAMVDRTFLVRAFQGYLFPELDAEVLWPLVERAHIEALPKGRELFAEGDPGDAFYLIRSGMVKVSKRSGDREMVLSYLVSGNSFGETALVPGTIRTASVSTIFDSELIRLDRADVEAFLGEHPELRGGFLAKLEVRRIDALAAEATPGAGDVLSDLIREEVVIGTDALIIDDYKCVRCGNCIAACEGVHEDRQARLSLTGIHFYNLLAPNSCWQCENPLCMLDCPPDAIVRDPRGEVYIKESCIGCGNCEANCPYGNIFMVHPQPRRGPFAWLRDLIAGGAEETRELAVKCDLCHGVGGGPACVRACPTGAAIRLTPGRVPGDAGGDRGAPGGGVARVFLSATRSRRWRAVALVLLVAAFVPFALERWRDGAFQHGGSRLGLAYGIAAAALVLLLTAFGLRKRAYRSRLGSLESWLGSHVWLGVLVAVVAVLHTGLRFEDRVALATLLVLLAVVASGLVGAYLYQVLPRRLTAVETNEAPEETTAELNRVAGAMARLAAGRSAAFRSIHHRLAAEARPPVWAGWRLVFSGAPAGGGAERSGGRGGWERLLGNVEEAEREELRHLLVLARQHRELRRGFLVQRRYRNLLDAWLWVHVPLTFALLALLAVHVAGALYYWGVP